MPIGLGIPDAPLWQFPSVPLSKLLSNRLPEVQQLASAIQGRSCYKSLLTRRAGRGYTPQLGDETSPIVDLLPASPIPGVAAR